jgi:pilus assembly protein CpaB
VKRSNRLVILVGVLLAVLAFVLVVILLNGQGGQNNPQATLKTKVLVAKENIDIGTAVTPEMVDVIEVDPDAVVGSALHDPSQVGGRPALVNVAARSQVNQETFGVGKGIDIQTQLKPGEKAIAIQVDRTTGLDFLVQPGNIVDVVLVADVKVLQPTADSTKENPRFEPVQGLEDARTVKTVLQQKRVLYVSQSRQQVAAAAASASAEAGTQAQQPAAALPDSIIIVIAGTDQDSELLRFAQKNQTESGVLGVTIRSTGDTADETTTGVTIDLLVKNYGLPIPGIVQEVGPSTAP